MPAWWSDLPARSRWNGCAASGRRFRTGSRRRSCHVLLFASQSTVTPCHLDDDDDKSCYSSHGAMCGHAPCHGRRGSKSHTCVIATFAACGNTQRRRRRRRRQPATCRRLLLVLPSIERGQARDEADGRQEGGSSGSINVGCCCRSVVDEGDGGGGVIARSGCATFHVIDNGA